MESLPTVLLKPGEGDRIVAGHPWIYHGEILRLTAPAADGALVQVKDHRQRLLGTGFYNSRSKINVRILAPERVVVDEIFFEERICAALAVRKKHLPDATSFRVVNAESDFLSGLIVDKYEDVLVVQISALGMDQRKEMIVAALQKIFAPRVIMERSDVSSRKFEGLQESNGVLFGESDGKNQLYGTSYEVSGYLNSYLPSGNNPNNKRKIENVCSHYVTKTTELPYASAGQTIGPSDMWIIYDADDTGYLPSGAVDPTRKNDNYPDPGDNHGAAGGNVVFCDGHAQWVAQKDYLRSFILGTDEYHPAIQ